MSTDILCDVLVEGCLDVDHPVGVVGGMENREVHDKGVALPRDDVLCNHGVSPWVCHLAKVKVGWKDVCLDLIISDLTRVKLNDEVFLESSHGEVCL